MARRERLANNAETTIASDVVPGDLTISVASATNFPTEGDFRIVVDNELMLVTSVSGTTFTVTRGIESTVASNHVESVGVAQVLTEAGMQKLIAESCDPFAFSRNPFRIQDTNGALLAVSDFTEIDASTVGVSYDNADGSITLELAAPDATERQFKIVRTAPATPYIMTMATTLNSISATADSGPLFGPIFRDSVNDENLMIRWRPLDVLASRLNINHYAVEVFQSSITAALRADASPSAILWWQIEDDGVDLFWRISTDGVHWITFHTVARATPMTAAPDQVGFGIVNAVGTGTPAFATLLAYDGE
jgi:hypothetical protein